MISSLEMIEQDAVCSYKIILSNIEDGETLHYSLALIAGNILRTNSHNCSSEQYITLNQLNDDSTTSQQLWPVRKSEFKILATLHHGSNTFVLEYSGTTLAFTLNFNTRNSLLDVIPVYIICKGHDGRFQSPAGEDNSVESACERIFTGAQLIQCITAEKLREANLGRKTFQLAHDLDKSVPKCIIFRSQLAVEDARQMEAGVLWEHFGRELMLSHIGSNKHKFMAFLSCTRYCLDSNCSTPKSHEETLSMVQAHVALGGGGLALFGSACLHTWPCSVSEVFERFSDHTIVDTNKLMDDSCYRGTYGGCFSTTLGAVCHELGHTFDLGHSEDGIMGRGFNNVDLVFTLQESSDSESMSSDDGNRNAIEFSADNNKIGQHSTIAFTKVLSLSFTMPSPIRKPRIKEEHLGFRKTRNNRHMRRNVESDIHFKEIADRTFWSTSCGVLLRYHKWFNEEVLSSDSNGGLKFDPHRKLVTSKAGIRVIELRDETSLVIQSWVFLNNQGRETFILPSGPTTWYRPSHTLVAEDSVGDIIKHTFSV